MRRFRLALAASSAVAGPAAADHPPGYGDPPGTPHPPLVSPPGWVGPGPNVGKRATPGPGNGWNYYGVPNGPSLGVAVWPYYGYGNLSRMGDFWSNYLSLYGPPVPTYGPTPGVFAQSDASRLYFKQPPFPYGPLFGLGWAGYRSPSPRPKPPTVGVWPTPGPVGEPGPFPPGVRPSPSAPPADSEPLPAPKEATAFRMSVRVPADAEVWIDKTYQSKQTGAVREFESPPLEAGQGYEYEVIARWTENGEPRTESRTVSARAGGSARVDFTRPAELAGR